MSKVKKIDLFKPSEITEITNTIKNLEDLGLSERMIIALVHDKTKLAKRTIKQVIDAIVSIETSIKMKFNATRNWSEWTSD